MYALHVCVCLFLELQVVTLGNAPLVRFVIATFMSTHVRARDQAKVLSVA